VLVAGLTATGLAGTEAGRYATPHGSHASQGTHGAAAAPPAPGAPAPQPASGHDGH
jgi:hypothetical protein